jgi:hypothetical protein
MSTNRRNRGSREIEADLNQTRARMHNTLDALQNKFTPGELFNDTLGYFRNRGGGEFASNLGDTVKNNPMPIALVGIGLAWLAMSGRDRSSRSAPTHSTDYGEPHDPYEHYAQNPEGMSAELTTQAYSEPVGPTSSDLEAYSEPQDPSSSEEVVVKEEVVVSRAGEEDPVNDQTQDTASGARGVSQDQDETLVRRI